MKVGIVGTGMIGSTVGRLWCIAGHTVKFAARDQRKLAKLVRELGANASKGTVDQVVRDSEAILFATPFGAWPELAEQYGHKLIGKSVLDASNPYPQRDGKVAEDVIKRGQGSGAFVAGLLPGVNVVKAFNTLSFETLAKESNRQGDRIGMAIAGDNLDALELVKKLVSDAGFDPVTIPSMARSKEIDPGMPVYNQTLSATQLREALNLPEINSTSNLNLRIVARFVQDFLGRGDLAAADDTADKNIQGVTGLKASGPIDGLEEYKGIITMFMEAFPPVEPLQIIDQFLSEDGSRVVTRFLSRQKHAADFLGLPATNRIVLFDETHVATVENGKIVKNIVSATNLEFEMLMAPILAPLILK